MKNLAFLAAMFVLILSVEPSIAEVYSSLNEPDAISCCEKPAQNTAPLHTPLKDCCSHGLCNPFNMCCIGYNLPIVFYLTPFYTITSDFISVLPKAIDSEFCGDSFHPPRLV